MALLCLEPSGQARLVPELMGRQVRRSCGGVLVEGVASKTGVGCSPGGSQNAGSRDSGKRRVCWEQVHREGMWQWLGSALQSGGQGPGRKPS